MKWMETEFCGKVEIENTTECSITGMPKPLMITTIILATVLLYIIN